MPERKDIKGIVTSILLEEGIEVENDEHELVLDSFDLVRIVIRLNSSFRIEIKASEILPENFSTIFSIEQFILGKQNTGPSNKSLI